MAANDGWTTETARAWWAEWTRRNGGTPVCDRATSYRVAKVINLPSEYVPELRGFYVRQESVWHAWSAHVAHRLDAWRGGRQKQRDHRWPDSSPAPVMSRVRT